MKFTNMRIAGFRQNRDLVRETQSTMFVKNNQDCELILQLAVLI